MNSVKKFANNFLPNEMPVVLLTAKNQVSDLVEGFGAVQMTI
jgi:two-component system sensor histidine kinase ChiS